MYHSGLGSGFSKNLRSPTTLTNGSNAMNMSRYVGQKSPCNQDRFMGLARSKSPSMRTPTHIENGVIEPDFGCTPRCTKRPPVVKDRLLEAPDVSVELPSKIIDISDTGKMAVVLGTSVYVWDEGEVNELMASETTIDSVCWVGDKLALSGGGHTELWDINRVCAVQLYKDHEGRVAAMSSYENRLATGGADGVIHVYDQRGGLKNRMNAHKGEVCSLAWSHDGMNLASSGTDRYVNVWGGKRRQKIVHDDAVLALTWMHSGVLVTGERGSDGMLRLFHTRSQDEGRYVATGKPITGLQWSPTWGIYVAHEDRCGTWEIWPNDLEKVIAEYQGHEQAILNIASSPEGDTVVTISGDERLRIWELSQPPKSPLAGPGEQQQGMRYNPVLLR